MKRHNSIAVLSDIHGNSLALEAVLNDVAHRKCATLFNLGDIFYGPLDPAGTWDMLNRLHIPTILGNQDRVLLEGGPEWEANPTFTRTRDAIGPDGLNWLASLPPSLTGTPDTRDILLCHGTPGNDTRYLLEAVTTGVPVQRPCEAILEDVLPQAAGCSLVLAGHSHHPGQVVCDGITVVNPGSVGLPAYDDDTPPHSMAAGSPHAQYAVLTPSASGWECDFISVEYDWKAAAVLARQNDREDWAQWLSTGMA
ncbi:metallophosphoesterase family protein [Pseudodesulfovibrio sediminis]|uniref:DNA methylase n=1 Tax=Pseudodesulfovibrio sediminis TaxID=2810563 RepID=A0ABN6EU33_9BACT|nr:metallophosphoesterase family protein [Pseudodesulfovibrio sediminis]BCS88685.1 DNA methylase [Pseudodesulfovibrio sediminis]